MLDILVVPLVPFVPLYPLFRLVKMGKICRRGEGRVVRKEYIVSLISHPCFFLSRRHGVRGGVEYTNESLRVLRAKQKQSQWGNDARVCVYRFAAYLSRFSLRIDSKSHSVIEYTFSKGSASSRAIISRRKLPSTLSGNIGLPIISASTLPSE